MASMTLRSLVFRATAPVACAFAFAAPLLSQPAAAQAPAPPSGLDYKGMLRLQGGNTTQVTYSSVGFQGGTAPALSAQTLAPIRRNDCRLSQPQASRLLGFFATQGGGAAPVGLVSGSLGVYSGSQGTPCSRFTAALNHELTVDLGQQLETEIPKVAFYRLELDIEAKSNLALELQVLLGDAVVDRFVLRTGSSIVAGEGSALPGARIFNCSAQSDSGPDAGGRDNCRWVIDALGQGFRLKPLAGEGSLEGGGDPGTLSTDIYLTEAEIGALGCGPGSTVPIAENTNTIGDGENEAQCAVTRVDPTDFGGQCTQPVGYVFRNLGGGAEGCELLKSPGEQLAASIHIRFPPEVTQVLGDEPLTQIQFSTGDPSEPLVGFEPERCIGTVVEDPNGTRTIKEVLLGQLYVGIAPLSDANDAVPGNGVIDWACILDNEQSYLGPPAPGSAEEMQVTQTILFWGDIRFSRQ